MTLLLVMFVVLGACVTVVVLELWWRARERRARRARRK
jgi:hypothetical protein